MPPGACSIRIFAGRFCTTPATVNPSSSLDALIAASGNSFRVLSNEERQATLDAAMADWQPGQDIWVYGYGSLVWRPEFPFVERRPAILHGFHRALCLWSRVNRGTPDRPGLVFGLDIGGSCRGMVYRVAADQVPDTVQELWRREMPSGAYIPKWLRCATGQGSIMALVFTMDRSKDAYVRGLTRDQLVTVIRQAHGTYGPCAEYVLETDRALKAVGIHDRRLDTIVRWLDEAMEQTADPSDA